MRHSPLLSFSLLFVLILTSCTPKQDSDTITLRIAEQYGLAYAPVQIVRKQKLLEERGISPEWIRLMNTASIREAMLADRADVGFMGIPPFLIGRDRGTGWKIFTGLCRSPLGLVTLRPDIHSLRDLGPNDRIALPQPGSIQHILLSMAAKEEFGTADYFDRRLLTLSHPDGMNALKSGGDVSAHFTSPPYLFEELALPGARLLVDGEEAFGGPFTFIVGTAAPGFADAEPETLRILTKVLNEAMELIQENPREAAVLLAEEYGIEAPRVEEYLRHPDLLFGTTVRGLARFGGFMYSTGLLNEPVKPDHELLAGPAAAQQKDGVQ